MTQTTTVTKVTSLKGDTSPDLMSSLTRTLKELDAGIGQFASSNLATTSQAQSVYKNIMRNGLRSLLGEIKLPENEAWEDAMDYCREVIQNPQDSAERAASKWTRSYSDLCLELLKRFGPEIVAAARNGCEALARDMYQGNPLSIAHVDKKANAMSLIAHYDPPRIFTPSSSFLATACAEQTALCCSIVVSAWQSPEGATKGGMMSHVAVADDYHAFTANEYDVRIRMIALSVGVAYELGGQAVNVLVDGAGLQAIGTGSQKTLEAALAWRAVSGNTAPYSGSIWSQLPIEEGLVAPELIMSTHDLFDWRSDAAAQNYENGVFAAYGLGFEDPFHTYLEAMLRRAGTDPLSGVHAMAAITHLQFTAVRYGSYRYNGVHGKSPCEKCEQTLKDLTAKAGFQWKPSPPPTSYAAGEEFRQPSKQYVDSFTDHTLPQTGLSWLQHLISSGDIWLFDATIPIQPLDSEADWA